MKRLVQRLRPIAILFLAMTWWGIGMHGQGVEPAGKTVDPGASGKSAARPGGELFSGPLPRIEISIDAAGMKTLRNYHQVWRQPRPERVDVPATIREGGKIYTNVLVHLKGSYSFQGVDMKPSLTLKFGKQSKGQTFHGMTKIHLNNSVQDPTYICEQLSRELFEEVDVPAARATPTLVRLNGRHLGLMVLIEGVDKSFLKSRLGVDDGRVFDGGSGGDIQSANNETFREDGGMENWGVLATLAKAVASQPSSRRRGAAAEILDVDQFVRFAALEMYLVHWDGYANGVNNYRICLDQKRKRLVFTPHGLDQIFGVSSNIRLSVFGGFKGLVAKGLIPAPDVRPVYLDALKHFADKDFTADKLIQRVDRLHGRIKPVLRSVELAAVGEATEELKERIHARCANVLVQLASPPRPRGMEPGKAISIQSWSFKSGPVAESNGARAGSVLRVGCEGEGCTGAFRSRIFLDKGKYRFLGQGRVQGPSLSVKRGHGVILRASGERSDRGLTVSESWQELNYEFQLVAPEEVELVCEFRGPEGAGEFDITSLKLLRVE